METRKIAAILVGDVVGYSYVLKGAMRRRVERCSHFARHVEWVPTIPPRHRSWEVAQGAGA
jgi:hypothetical protein